MGEFCIILVNSIKHSLGIGNISWYNIQNGVGVGAIDVLSVQVILVIDYSYSAIIPKGEELI